eukprot:scaffold1720_cov238-Pinguiococcus_pyrenoidosus.AAC.1
MDAYSTLEPPPRGGRKVSKTRPKRVRTEDEALLEEGAKVGPEDLAFGPPSLIPRSFLRVVVSTSILAFSLDLHGLAVRDVPPLPGPIVLALSDADEDLLQRGHADPVRADPERLAVCLELSEQRHEGGTRREGKGVVLLRADD